MKRSVVYILVSDIQHLCPTRRAACPCIIDFFLGGGALLPRVGGAPCLIPPPYTHTDPTATEYCTAVLSSYCGLWNACSISPPRYTTRTLTHSRPISFFAFLSDLDTEANHTSCLKKRRGPCRADEQCRQFGRQCSARRVPNGIVVVESRDFQTTMPADALPVVLPIYHTDSVLIAWRTR